MKANRMITLIAVVATAGTIVLTGCSDQKTAEEEKTPVNSSMVTEANTVKETVIKEDSIGSGKPVVKKTDRSSKAVKTNNTVSVPKYDKNNKTTDDKDIRSSADKKKAADSTKEPDLEPSSNEGEPAENKTPDSSEASSSTSDPNGENSSASESTDSSMPVIPEVPEAEPSPEMIPEEAPVELPETTHEEPPAAPAHEHTWEEIRELVHHDAVYGEPPLLSPAQDITYDVTEMHTICGICGANLDEVGVEHDYMHAENGEGFWYYNDYIVVGQRTEHFDAVYGEPPLITPAYDEWVGTGRYQCTGCGETK